MLRKNILTIYTICTVGIILTSSNKAISFSFHLEIIPLIDTTYFSEKGMLLNSVPSEKTITYVVKTIKTKESIYANELHDSITYQGKKYPSAINVERISRRLCKQAEKLIKNGKFNNSIVIKNTVQILNKNTLVEIRKKIKDYGEKGIDSANYREFGGIINEGNIIFDTFGKPSIPTDSTLATVWLDKFGTEEYHSHPSGCVEIETEGQSYKKYAPAGSAVIVIGGIRNRCFSQGPSGVDKYRIGDRIGYVYAMRDRIIYIYNKTGIIATLTFRVVEKGS